MFAALSIALFSLTQTPANVQQSDPAACRELASMIRSAQGALSPPLSNAAALDAANRCVSARGNADDYNRRGFVHTTMREYALAEADYTRSIALIARPATYLNRGLSRRDARQYEGAVADFREALRLGHSDPARLRNEMAIALRLQGRLDEAMNEAKASFAIDPQRSGALREQAEILYAQQRWDESVGVLTRYLSMEPSSARGYNRRGQGLIELGRNAAALEDYDRAVALDNRFTDAIANRGVALSRLGRFAEAVAATERAISFDGSNIIYWNNLCLQRSDAGNQSGALAACDRAEQLDPSQVERGINMVFRGMVSERLGRMQAAEAYYRDGIRLGVTGRNLTRAQDGLRRLGVAF